MNKSLLAVTLVLASSFALRAPAFASLERSALPPTVRAVMPSGATSYLCERLPLGFGGTKALVHIWGSVRGPASSGYSNYLDSPFCIDVFLPAHDEKGQWGWHLVSSAVYLDSDAPGAVVPHWLQPSKKDAPILEVISSSGAPGVSTTHRIFTWDQGFREGYRPPTPQEFGSGGSGGGMITAKFDEVDARGYMVITSTDTFGNQVNSVTRYVWNGEQFAAPAAPK